MLKFKKNLCAILLVAMICLPIIASVNLVSAKKDTIDVYASDSIESIQSAIDTAPLGTTIVFHAGTYILPTTITVNQQVTLTGKGAVLEYVKPTRTSGAAAINVLADNVQIKGFTIQVSYAAGAETTLLTGIEIGKFSPPTGSIITTGCIIDSNTIVSPNWGISGYGQQAFTVSNNVISAEFPVWFTNPHNAVIKNNIITAQTYPTGPTVPSIAYTNMIGQMAGIKVTNDVQSCSIKNNQITSEAFGILVYSGTPATVIPTNVEITANQITAHDGIYSNVGNNFDVKNNRVNAANYAIWLLNQQGTTTVSGNTIISGSTNI